MSGKKPFMLVYSIGPVCEAGQHENCTPVADPYEAEEQASRKVWVCECDCHGIE